MSDSKLRILFLETFYPESAAEQLGTRTRGNFRANDVRHNFFVEGLERLGHEVRRLVLNVEPRLSSKVISSRKEWPNKHVIRIRNLYSRIPLAGQKSHSSPEIRHLKKLSARESYDVVLNGNLNAISSQVLSTIFPMSKIVGLIASPLPKKSFLSKYDLVFSSLPPVVADLEKLGIQGKLLLGSFDPTNYGYAIRPWNERDIDICFVGSIGMHHLKTLRLLRAVAKCRAELQIYTSANPFLLSLFGLGKYHRGKAYGREMFEILGRTKICINRHAWFARGHSNNMRIFETIGMGSLLVTERSLNISEILNSSEVATYVGSKDIASVVDDLIANDERSQKIASAGRAAFLDRHSSTIRAKQMSDELKKLLSD